MVNFKEDHQCDDRVRLLVKTVILMILPEPIAV